MKVIDVDPVAAKALPDRWYYLQDEDMYLLNMKAKCNDDYVIDLDCIVALTEESRAIGKWYWHTRTIFCNYEGYEDEFEEAMNKSMKVAYDLFNRHNAIRIQSEI